MKRQIVKIDEDKCTGCELCIPNCHEGALQIIDGKVRLISDLMCDGLGACLGHCPEGAITLEEREAEPYSEITVMQEMVTKGKNTVIAHLKHLKEHGETGFLKEGVKYLEDHQDEINFDVDEVKNAVHGQSGHAGHHHGHAHFGGGGCPGSRTMSFDDTGNENNNEPSGEIRSELKQWPVQLHLVSPAAPYFRNSDLLVAADCVAFSIGDFHRKFLKGKSLAIACPKLDDGLDVYRDKITAMVNESNLNTITVMIMQVPCCHGLLQIVQQAVENASRKIPVKALVISLQGEILQEQWV